MRNTSSRTWFTRVSLLGALLLGACATTNPVESASAKQAPTPKSCSACMQNQCPVTYLKCAGDAKCAETFSCVEKCPTGNKQCVWDCMLARPDTAARMFSAGECGTTLCKDSCTLPDGVIDSCPVCSAKYCPSEINICFGNKECWDLVACVRETCTDNDVECAQGCIGKHPGGLAEIQDLRDCSAKKCVAACTRK